jgi:hypothetical protein
MCCAAVRFVNRTQASLRQGGSHYSVVFLFNNIALIFLIHRPSWCDAR